MHRRVKYIALVARWKDTQEDALYFWNQYEHYFLIEGGFWGKSARRIIHLYALKTID